MFSSLLVILPLISLPCNLPIDLVSPQKPPSLISLTIFPTYVEIVTAPSWSALTYRRPLTLLTTEYCWIDSTLILVLTVLPSRGFAPTFPTDLNTLSLAITLPPRCSPCWGPSGLCPRTPAFHDLYLTPVRHS